MRDANEGLGNGAEDYPLIQELDNTRLLNQTAMMVNTMTESFTLANALQGIRHFNGKSPLKDFLQDVKNGANYVPLNLKGNYVRAVLGKLTGAARDSTYGKTINTVEDLTSHLKNRFAPGPNFAYYQEKINKIRRKTRLVIFMTA